MRRVLSLLRVVVTLSLVLPASCATSPDRAPDGARSQAEPSVVRVSELPDGRLRLAFGPTVSDPTLEELRVEEARAILAAFYASLPPVEKLRPRLVQVSAGPTGMGERMPAEWERKLREQFVSRYGPPPRALPESLAESPLVMALRLSPRYMGAGVSEAARELFSSPAFMASIALSVAVYFSAWLLPEPIFSKTFVAALTLLVGALELSHVALTCLRLYQEVEAARTVAELEAAAERFGKAMGGTGLRVLVLVASMGVAKELPQVPEGGLGALLRAPRYELGQQLLMGGSTTVQMVADGTVIVTGAVAGTAAATLGSACTDGSTKKDGHQWHHIATDKNDISPVHGGPWTPMLKELFDQAGMSLNAAENLVYLQGHKGPHPEAYHQEIYERLKAALGRCSSIEQCRHNLIRELRAIAEEICTPGTLLHRLATRQ